jgi:hypothetical protein
MEEDILFSMRQFNCNHRKQELYTQRCFDILNGFEFNLKRCLNCHKIVELESKKFSMC